MPSQPAHRWTNTELYEALRRVAKRLGHPPTVHEYDELSLRVRKRGGLFPAARQIVDRFGTWNGALRLVGMTPPPAPRSKDTRTIEGLLS